ncbi:methylated-DNA--[protein]-cysteine S-methyltransferase [Listeria aquatica]|uniref:methylated-DNA--[protein]-cysteine S-methyltransferase n=1 Tax=Listeria aquatica TaxID=1494960 RepID=UPI003F6ECD0A
MFYGTMQEQGLVLAKTKTGVCFIGNSLDQLKSWKKRHLPKEDLQYDEAKLAVEKQQLLDYYQGKRQTFDFPLDLEATPFSKSVYQALQQIPYGHTTTYGEIAEKIGRKTAVRAVGRAIGANPIWIVIPCHRVIGKDGSLTGYAGGLDMKTALLALEKAQK